MISARQTIPEAVDHAANKREEVFNDMPADSTSVDAIAVVAVELDSLTRLSATSDRGLP
jgi:hypothetical protein